MDILFLIATLRKVLASAGAVGMFVRKVSNLLFGIFWIEERKRAEYSRNDGDEIRNLQAFAKAMMEYSKLMKAAGVSSEEIGALMKDLMLVRIQCYLKRNALSKSVPIFPNVMVNERRLAERRRWARRA
jgi:hypothetical protein